jgi:hypothetical protein
MSSEEEHNKRRDEIAQSKFGKTFEECDPMERVTVGGTLGGETRKEQMAAEHGGSAHEAYAEMGKKGGEARKEQLTEEAGGDTHKAYQELGQQQGKKE